MAGPSRQFLDAISKDKRFFLPLPFMWTVDFQASVTGEVNDALNKAGINMAMQPPDNWSKGRTSGCLVAQEITIPPESVVFTNIGQPNRGGAMPGQAVVERTDYLSRTASVNFIETDEDIVDNAFRPWIAAIGVNGLIDGALRGDAMTFYQFGKDGSLRKTIGFKSFFPTTCEGYTVNYGGDEFTIKTVSFSYEEYSVS